MRFLQDITKAEREAQKKVDEARKKAQESIALAEAKENDEVEKMQASILKSREVAIADARERADKEGRALVEKARREADRLDEMDKKNQERSVTSILETL